MSFTILVTYKDGSVDLLELEDQNIISGIIEKIMEGKLVFDSNKGEGILINKDHVKCIKIGPSEKMNPKPIEESNGKVKAKKSDTK